MRKNEEILQFTFTQKYFDRIDSLSNKKKNLIDNFCPYAKSILDLESEIGCFEKDEGDCFTQITHLEKHLVNSIYKNNMYYNKEYDVIISYEHLEYEKDILKIAPYIMSHLSKKGSWIIRLPVNNKVEDNYLGRIHEFSSESAIIFASKLSYNFCSIDMNDSVILIIN